MNATQPVDPFTERRRRRLETVLLLLLLLSFVCLGMALVPKWLFNPGPNLRFLMSLSRLS
jgi:hypothetical protein